VARIAPAGPFDDSALVDLDDGARTDARLASIYGHRPAVARALRDLATALRETGTLPPRLVELVRLRVAFHNQCRSWR
jgi:alkylhydroperoxidase family enzyme